MLNSRDLGFLSDSVGFPQPTSRDPNVSTYMKTIIHMDGGTLTVEWNRTNGHVFMNGPATKVFDGVIDTDV